MNQEAESRGNAPKRVISEPEYTMNAAEAGSSVDPEKYAVDGVYFTCPLIGWLFCTLSRFNCFRFSFRHLSPYLFSYLYRL